MVHVLESILPTDVVNYLLEYNKWSQPVFPYDSNHVRDIYDIESLILAYGGCVIKDIVNVVVMNPTYIWLITEIIDVVSKRNITLSYTEYGMIWFVLMGDDYYQDDAKKLLISHPELRVSSSILKFISHYDVGDQYIPYFHLFTFKFMVKFINNGCLGNFGECIKSYIDNTQFDVQNHELSHTNSLSAYLYAKYALDNNITLDIYSRLICFRSISLIMGDEELTRRFIKVYPDVRIEEECIIWKRKLASIFPNNIISRK